MYLARAIAVNSEHKYNCDMKNTIKIGDKKYVRLMEYGNRNRKTIHKNVKAYCRNGKQSSNRNFELD